MVGDTTASISKSYARGNVTTPSGNTTVYAGGLAGRTSSTVSECYAEGNVSADRENTGDAFVGGLLGYTSNSVSDCYAKGTVTSTNGNYVGGLVGQLDNDGVVVDKCYTTGSVAGNIGVGGITGGRTTSTSATVRNCVALGASITGSDSSDPNLIGRITGRTDAGDPNNNPATVTTCYAISTMTLNPDRTLEPTYDGTSVTDEQTKTPSNWENADYWTDAGYSTGVWNIVYGSYPTLRNIP